MVGGGGFVLMWAFRFSAGKSTALIVDIGQDLVSVVPVCEGYAIRAGESWYVCVFRSGFKSAF